MACLDVAALYTSIPQDDTIQVLIEVWDARETPHKVPTTFLSTLAELALKRNYFVYKQEFFQQISGTAMGATFAPPLANLYMHFFEEQYVYSSRFALNIIKWYRYIDDIFLLGKGSRDLLDEFFQYLNTCNVNIGFEMDVQAHELHFLDVKIFKHPEGFLTTVYTKPTHRNTLLHYMSFHPQHLKRSLPYSQLLRCRRICSTLHEFKTQAKTMGYVY